MTKPISDERLANLVDMLGIDTDFDEHGFSIKRGTLRTVFARIEALTAERDAAVARLPDWAVLLRLSSAEGERRATAAIVAWLRGLPSYRVNRSVIAELERGGHLPPLDT